MLVAENGAAVEDEAVVEGDGVAAGEPAVAATGSAGVTEVAAGEAVLSMTACACTPDGSDDAASSVENTRSGIRTDRMGKKFAGNQLMKIRDAVPP